MKWKPDNVAENGAKLNMKLRRVKLLYAFIHL